MWNLKLSKKELLIFRCISSGINDLGSISRAVELSVNRVSEVLTKLERKGFIQETDRRPKRVEIRNLEHPMALHALFVEMDYIDWSEYLKSSSIPVLINIADEFLRPDQMAHDVSLKTVYNVLNKFKSIGGIRKRGGAYGISSRFPLLRSFLISYSGYYYRQWIREMDADAWIIRIRGNKVLFGTRKTIENESVEMTGIQAVPEFFPDLVTDHFLYVVPRRDMLTSEEHLAYTLLGLSNERRVRRAIKDHIRDNAKNLDISLLLRLAEKMGIGHLLENGG